MRHAAYIVLKMHQIVVSDLVETFMKDRTICPIEGLILKYEEKQCVADFYCQAYIDGIRPKGPYQPCLRMADRALLAGYPQYNLRLKLQHDKSFLTAPSFTATLTSRAT